LADERHLAGIAGPADLPGGALFRGSLLDHFLHAAAVVRIDEVVAELRIVAAAAPVKASIGARKYDRVRQAHRRERAIILRVLEQIFAIGRLLGCEPGDLVPIPGGTCKLLRL